MIVHVINNLFDMMKKSSLDKKLRSNDRSKRSDQLHLDMINQRLIHGVEQV